jgi:hypothetical protein
MLYLCVILCVHHILSQGRENTPEEEEWLNSPDLPAWARSQLVKKG